MTDKLIENSELVSALVDGQLHDAEFAQVMAHLEDSSEARQRWHSYHVVGDALRTGQADVSAHDADFVLRLRTRLQQESPSLVVQAPVKSSSQAVRRSSANDPLWRMVVGLASVAVVAVLAWQGFKGSEAPGAQLAVAPQAGTTAGDPDVTPVMIRDPQLDALMAAHRQFGGTSALQMPTGFLRNATFEAGAR
ncbi:MAG: hypothetical protein RL300_389 [Pseudomonadota bacterium]